MSKDFSQADAGLSKNINAGINLFLKTMLLEGVITDKQLEIAAQYVFIFANSNFIGRTFDNIPSEKLTGQVVKLTSIVLENDTMKHFVPPENDVLPLQKLTPEEEKLDEALEVITTQYENLAKDKSLHDLCLRLSKFNLVDRRALKEVLAYGLGVLIKEEKAVPEKEEKNDSNL